MKHVWKTVVLSCAVWMSGSAIHSVNASANPAEQGVKIQVNDQLVQFQEAQPYIASDGQTVVPMRPVLEAMGYRLDWSMDNDQVTIAAQDDKAKKLEVKTGASEALLNGKQIKLQNSALMQQGTVYIPLQLVSETLGYILQWDNDNGIAIIGQDGQYHAPAWYKPTKADKLAETAKSLTGIRYVWGGTTTKGFDCSGFVNYVFDQYGIDLPRTSRSMYDTSGESVIGLQKGDLVFFNIGKVTTHVGIYLGDGQFVSATTSSGTKIDSIYSSYWNSKFIGAKRVL